MPSLISSATAQLACASPVIAVPAPHNHVTLDEPPPRVTTPKPAAGTGRSPATPGSSPACSATSTGSNNPAWRTLRVDPGLRAG